MSHISNCFKLNLKYSGFPETTSLFQIPGVLRINPSFFLAFRHNLHTKPFFVPKKHGSQKWQKAKQSVENLFRKTAIYDFGRLPEKILRR